METIWIILGVATLILLAVYWGSKNAVWGGFTIGIVIGLIIALFSGFEWYVVGKAAVSGTITGFGAELLGRVSDKMRNRK